MGKSDQNHCRRQNNISARMYSRADVTMCKFPEQNHAWHPLREVRIWQEGTDFLGISNLPTLTSSPQDLLCNSRRGIAILHHARHTWKKLEVTIHASHYFLSFLYYFLHHLLFFKQCNFSCFLLFSLLFRVLYSGCVSTILLHFSSRNAICVASYFLNFSTLQWKVTPSLTRKHRLNLKYVKQEKFCLPLKMKPVSVGCWRKILDVIRSNCVLTLHRIISPIIEN